MPSDGKLQCVLGLIYPAPDRFSPNKRLDLDCFAFFIVGHLRENESRVDLVRRGGEMPH